LAARPRSTKTPRSNKKRAAAVAAAAALREYSAQHYGVRAMNTKDVGSLNLDYLSLEPIENSPERAAPITGRATFNTDTRARLDRRKGSDRRQTVRFEQDRRSGKDRRPRTSWADSNSD
jgi:hypothetical protein